MAGGMRVACHLPRRMLRYSIRRADERDCADLARLAGQLGYPTPEEAMRGRLERLLDSPGDAIFVAESDDGGLIGWVHGVLSQFLESEYRLEVGGLVVDERLHRKGIGRALMERVENWALERGATHIIIRSRSTRTEAHHFYEKLGYSQSKVQVVFRKALPRKAEVVPGGKSGPNRTKTPSRKT